MGIVLNYGDVLTIGFVLQRDLGHEHVYNVAYNVLLEFVDLI